MSFTEPPSERPGLPINRIVAFAGPLIAVVAGAVADWLFVHLHFLGNFPNREATAGWVSNVAVWGLTSLLVWLGESKWLDGWQRFEVRAYDVIAEARAAEAVPPVNPATKLPHAKP